MDRRPECLRLWLLGQFRVERGDDTVPDSAWERPTARALIKLLAIQPGHRLHQDQVLDQLWPDLSPDAALAGLRKATTFARHALEPARGRGESTYLHAGGGLLSLNADAVWIDADQFQKDAEAALRGGDEARLRDALSFYGGELLPGDRYEEWTLDRRASLDELHQRLLLGLADVTERRREYAEAIDCLQKVLRTDSTREDVHRRLMRLHAVSGNRHQALRQYQHCAEALQDELGVAPEPESSALYEEIASGRFAPEPASICLQSAPLPGVIRRFEGRPFVGRELPMNLLHSELTQLTRAVDARGAGRRGVVLIGGEAGVGKTRLAAEMARLAHAEHVLVLWGSSYEEEGRSPYAPFVEAFQDYLAGRSSEEQQAIADAYGELARLLPALSSQLSGVSHGGQPHLGSEGSQLRLFADVVRFLSDLSGSSPLLLLLDDLHVADPASLQLLHHLARVAPDNRWLIVGTYRQEEVAGTPLQMLRTSLTRASLCRHIDLLQLSRDDSTALIQSLLTEGAVHPDVVDRLYALSLGNPLFLQELVESMQDQGLVLSDGVWKAPGTSVELPARVRDLIAGRIGRLPEQIQAVLALAAAGGMEINYTVLRRAAHMDDGALLDACDQAMEARIIEERGSNLAFRHPLIRQAIYERLSLHRRRYLHTSLAEAYKAFWTDQLTDEYVETIAYHFRQAEAAEAAEWLERAGDRAAAIYATDAAVTQYRDAQERLAGGNQEAQARLEEKVGNVLLSAGRYDEALDVLERAWQRYEITADLESLGRTAAAMGLANRWRGTAEAGIARVESAVALLAGTEASYALAACHVALAHLYLLQGDYRKALAVAEQAREFAAAVGADALLAEAQERQGTVLLLLDRSEEGKQILEATIPLAEASGNLDLLRRTLVNAGCAAAYLGEHVTERRYFERALESAERIGNLDQVAFVLGNLGSTCMTLGEWGRAREYLDRAVDLARSRERTANLSAPVNARGQLALYEGDLETARALIGEALTIAEETGNRQAREHSLTYLAELDILEGCAEDAVARLEASIGSDDVDLLLLASYARALLESGDAIRAEQVVDVAVMRARDGETLSLAEVLLVQAAVQRGSGCEDDAYPLLTEALALARSMQDPYLEARIHYALGSGPGAVVSSSEARSHLEQAVDTFRRLGARLDIERAEQALEHVRCSAVEVVVHGAELQMRDRRRG